MHFERLAPAGQGLVAYRALYYRRDAKLFVMWCQVSFKNIHHIKLEVVRMAVLLLFSVKSIIQKEAFINLSLIFFLKNGEAN